MGPEPVQQQADERKDSLSNCSSGEITGKVRAEEPERVSGGLDDDSDEQNPKRRLDSPSHDCDRSQGGGDQEKADGAEDTEYKRLRRRITNRESAKRMRLKRQEELANFQKELKRVKGENEQLRGFTSYLQKQNIFMATDAQHWRTKCAGLENDITTLFQQMQQVAAIAAAINPGILDAVATQFQAPGAGAKADKPAAPGQSGDMRTGREFPHWPRPSSNPPGPLPPFNHKPDGRPGVDPREMGSEALAAFGLQSLANMAGRAEGA